MEDILKTVPRSNQSAIIFLKNGFEENLGSKRVVFLGLHGSSRHISISAGTYSDIDLELVLDQVSSDDLRKIKAVIDNAGKKVECQVRSVEEISEPSSLIFETKYKIFMYWAYANSITLIGKNVYQELINKFTDKEYRDSLLINIQLNWKDLRKKYLSAATPAELNKLTEVFLFDVLLFCGYLDYKDLDKKKLFEFKRYNVSQLSADFFKLFLTAEETGLLLNLQNNMAQNKFDIEILRPLQIIFSKFMDMASQDKKSGTDTVSPAVTASNF